MRPGRGGAAAAARRRALRRAQALACSALAAASTSSLVRRPSLPVPLTVAGIDAVFEHRAAHRRATARRARRSVAGAGLVAVAGAGSAWRGGAALRSRRGAGAGGSGGAVPRRSSRSSRRPARCRRPATACCAHHAGDGRRAPRPRPCRSRGWRSARRPATASPGCFSHSPRVASVIDSPSAGTLTSVAMSLLLAPRERRSAFLLTADFGADDVAERVGDERALLGLVALGEAGRGRGRGGAAGVARRASDLAWPASALPR